MEFYQDRVGPSEKGLMSDYTILIEASRVSRGHDKG